jgi:preprotein translocase subunit SecG
MGFFIGFLTFVMVVDCLVLVLLVLIQLPKKEAGAGLAFGGGATDALFGAGSGNVLTKITKYTATAFFALAILLGLLQSHYHSRGTSAFKNLLEQPSRPVAAPVTPAPTTPTPSTPGITPPGSVVPLSSTNLLTPGLESTNVPAVTNGPAPAK